MRSCKEAGTGCLPPRCRTGVSAARLQVAHLDPLRIAGPRSAQAAPLVTPCLRDHRHRPESDALVHRPPGSAAYRRPATARAGHRPEGVPVLSPSAGPAGPAKADQHLPGHRPSRAARTRTPRVGVATSRAFPRTGHPLHPGTSVIPGVSAIHTISTERGQLSAFGGGYPLVYSQPVHRLPDVTRGTPRPPSPHVIS